MRPDPRGLYVSIPRTWKNGKPVVLQREWCIIQIPGVVPRERGEKMTVRAGVGWSLAKDAREAAAEAVEMAQAGLQGQFPSLALLFATVDTDLPTLVREISRRIRKTPIFGGTSFAGVFTPAGFQSGPDGAMALMLLSDVRAGVSFCPLGKSARRAGALAAGLARRKVGPGKPPDVFLMLTPPGSEEAVVAGISGRNPGIPVVGGSPADNTIEGKWKAFANGRVLENTAVVAALAAPGRVG
ncbi:MAG: hypothetical protein D6793_03245, partial [Thermoflexia bacterium]